MKHRSSGFTIIEILVVVFVLGILLGITAFAVNGWQERSATNQVRHDLQSAANSLKDYRNFSSGYPVDQAAYDQIYETTETVEHSYTRRLDGSFCLNAHSAKRPAVQWYLDSRTNAAQPDKGRCT